MAAFAPSDAGTSYTFWVFGLLHPSQINVYPDSTARLHVNSQEGAFIVEGPRPLIVDPTRTPLSVTGPRGRSVSFVLEIPGVIRRRYFGSLSITSAGRLLRPIVLMNREVAVCSIVGAELPAHTTPRHALSAQALAARSFLSAQALHARHADAQFCDTTHCQFLRSPAPVGSLVAQAVRATQGLVLCSAGVVIPAHYSAACGGHTDNAQLDHYQYRSVTCEPCRQSGTKRRGHGLGLCQTGAISLARAGWSFERIVTKYYPDCVIQSA